VFHQPGDAVDHAGVARTPRVDVVAAEQTNRCQRGARSRALAVAVPVHRLPRTTGNIIKELDRLLDDAIIHNQVLRQFGGLQRLNLPTHDGGIAVAVWRVAPTSVGALRPLDEVDRGLRVRLEHRVFGHAVGFAQRNCRDGLFVHVPADFAGIGAGRRAHPHEEGQAFLDHGAILVIRGILGGLVCFARGEEGSSAMPVAAARCSFEP